MTQTLEQELAAFVAGSDYRVKVWNNSYLHVTVYYVGGREAVQVGHKLFGGRRRWKKAVKWMRSQIAGHRELLAAGIQQP